MGGESVGLGRLAASMVVVCLLATGGLALGEWQRVAGVWDLQLPDLQTLKGSSLSPSDSRWAGWLPEIQAIESRYPRYDLEKESVLFIGSSSARLWGTLRRDFPSLLTYNHGFGGSQIVDSVYFFDRLVKPIAPGTIVMYAGTNDLGSGKSPAQVLADYIAFANKVHEVFPETKFFYISVAPAPSRWDQRNRQIETNMLIEAYTKTDPRLFFIDVFPYMLGADGTPVRDLYVPDMLHLSPKGYALWTDIVGLHLASAGVITSTPVAELRVSPLLQSRRLTGPQRIEVSLHREMVVEEIQVLLDGEVVLTPQEFPFALVVNEKGDLSEGVHTLEIRAHGEGTILTQTHQFTVEYLQVMRGSKDPATSIFPLKIQTGLPNELIESVCVSIDGVVLWQGQTLPQVLDVDPRTFRRRVQLVVEMKTVTGLTPKVDLLLLL